MITMVAQQKYHSTVLYFHGFWIWESRPKMIKIKFKCELVLGKIWICCDDRISTVKVPVIFKTNQLIHCEMSSCNTIMHDPNGYLGWKILLIFHGPLLGILMIFLFHAMWIIQIRLYCFVEIIKRFIFMCIFFLFNGPLSKLMWMCCQHMVNTWVRIKATML